MISCKKPVIKDYKCLRFNKPVGYLKFMNITVALHGKIPNKFQIWMLKKCFGFEITEEKKDEK